MGDNVIKVEFFFKEFIVDVVKGLWENFGLNFFNFDVIKDFGVGNYYYVIDINYFFGYVKMLDFEIVFIDFLFEFWYEKFFISIFVVDFLVDLIVSNFDVFVEEV